MKVKLILVISLILVIFLTNSCTHDDKELNKVVEENKKLSERLIGLQDVNNELSERLIELQDKNNKEVESLNRTIDKLEEENMILTSEASNEFSHIYHGMAHSNVKVKVVLKEPLRSFPDDDAPYIRGYGGLSDSKTDYETKVVEGELLYSTIDGGRKEWCFIIADGELGYVEETQISEYTEQIHNYSPAEQFKDLRIGMTVEDVYNIFGDKVEMIYPKLRYFRMLGVHNEYEIDGMKHIDEVVSFFYNPNTRIIDFIGVYSKEYELESGYKVGDSISEVFGYYDKLYSEVQDMPFNFGEEHRLYDIGDGYWLELQGMDGILVEIIISPGYNIYT